MVNYKDIINTKPLGSIERLDLIASYCKKEQSEAAMRCILKRIKRINKKWCSIRYFFKRTGFYTPTG